MRPSLVEKKNPRSGSMMIRQTHSEGITGGESQSIKYYLTSIIMDELHGKKCPMFVIEFFSMWPFIYLMWRMNRSAWWLQVLPRKGIKVWKVCRSYCGLSQISEVFAGKSGQILFFLESVMKKKPLSIMKKS